MPLIGHPTPEVSYILLYDRFIITYVHILVSSKSLFQDGVCYEGVIHLRLANEEGRSYLCGN